MNATRNLTQKERAVYYNRVSTDDEDQLTSLVNQKQDSERIIAENDWILVDHYIDEAKSGTTTKRRNEYNRMCKDMETDKFDIIVIKDQSRLMRNTREWYIFIDRLVQNKKKLYFYLERKFYSPDDALITGIRAILAEDYSRSLSKNIGNAHRTRQKNKNGSIILNSKTWGYDNLGKNNIVVNEEEAALVRHMFHLARYNDYGIRTIEKVLEKEGYKNRNGKRIEGATISRILRNPLYKGVARMNYLQNDFETKTRVRVPESEWIYHENAVPAIIDEETWDVVNRKMNERLEYSNSKEWATSRRGKKRNMYPLSGKITCGLCGKTFNRITRSEENAKYRYWACREYITHGKKEKDSIAAHTRKVSNSDAGCSNILIGENKIYEALYTIAQRVYNKPNDELINEVMRIISLAISDNSDILEREEKLNEELEKARNSREVLLDKYLEGIIADDIYRSREQKLIESIDEIESELVEISLKKNTIDDQQERLDRIRKEAKNIADKDLAIKNIINHVTEIVAMPEYITVSFDVLEDVIIDVDRKNPYKYKLIVR